MNTPMICGARLLWSLLCCALIASRSSFALLPYNYNFLHGGCTGDEGKGNVEEVRPANAVPGYGRHVVY